MGALSVVLTLSAPPRKVLTRHSYWTSSSTGPLITWRSCLNSESQLWTQEVSPIANLTVTESNNLLAASSGQAAYPAVVSPVLVALVTVMGTATAAGTEVVNTGGSQYARQQITFAVPSGGVIASSNALTYVNMPAATIVGVDEFDSTPAGSGGPVRRWFGALSTIKTVNAGDSFSVSIGSYSKSMS